MNGNQDRVATMVVRVEGIDSVQRVLLQQPLLWRLLVGIGIAFAVAGGGGSQRLACESVYPDVEIVNNKRRGIPGSTEESRFAAFVPSLIKNSELNSKV